MKKIILILWALSGLAFALTDTDADGVADDQDICPRVYARSTTGCPTLAPPVTSLTPNNCLAAQLKNGKTIVTIRPVCDATTKVCPRVANILGVQSCDPIFPVIFDQKTGLVLVRGSIYIVDYTK